MSRKLLAAFASLAALSVASGASAATIVDTGAPASISSYYSLGSGQSLFGRFTANVNTITGIAGYFLNETGSTQSVTATLYADDGSAPAASLGSASFSVASQSFANQLAGASGLAFGVVSGASYWIGFSKAASDPALAVADGVPQPLTAYGVSNNGTGGAFVRADSLNIGLVVNGENVTAAVPESATWALMIIGFGAVGGSLRLRRQRLTFA